MLRTGHVLVKRFLRNSELTPRGEDDVTDALSLESLYVGAHPVIQPILERLRVRAFLEETLGKPDPRTKLSLVDGAMLLLRNFTISRHPMYGVPGWTRQFDPKQLALQAGQVRLINDDRLGRVLDKLFVSDRRSMMTRLVTCKRSRRTGLF